MFGSKTIRFVYQDESGAVNSPTCPFVVGILFVRQREPIWEAIQSARDKVGFHNEIHFQKFSPLRDRAYRAVLETLATVRAHYFFSAIVVRRENLNLKFFSHRKHLAYNYFTKLLLQNRCSLVHEAVMFADAKNRLKEDNFFGYLLTEINVRFARPVLKTIESMDSKKDDLMQVTDLLTGCANSVAHGQSVGRKLEIQQYAQELGLIHNIWDWRPA